MPLSGWDKVDRNNDAYKACLAVSTSAGSIIGGATGSVAPVAGTIVGYASGAVWGFVFGYMACPYLVPAIRKKIESGMPLSVNEVDSAAEAMGKYAGVQNATDALKLLKVVKTSKKRNAMISPYSNPYATAKVLLSRV